MEKIRPARFIACVLISIAVLAAGGCGREEEKKAQGEAPAPPSPPSQEAPAQVPAMSPSETFAAPQSRSGDLVAEVDGAKLTKKELDAQLAKMMASVEGKVPADKKTRVKENMRRQLRDNFIIRTLLTNEIARRKIKTADKEVDDALAEMKAHLPQNVTLDDFMKQNRLTPENMREEIRFGITVKKLVEAQAGKKHQATDKEIKKFL